MKRIKSRSTPVLVIFVWPVLYFFQTERAELELKHAKVLLNALFILHVFPVFVVLHTTILLECLSITRFMNWNLAPCLKYCEPYYWWHWNWVSFHHDDELHWVMGQWFPGITELPCIFWVEERGLEGEGGSLHSEMDVVIGDTVLKHSRAKYRANFASYAANSG